MPKRYQPFAKEYVVSLFPIFMMIDAIERWATSLPFVIEAGRVTYYIKPSVWGASHTAMVRRIKRDPSWLARVFEMIEKLGSQQARATQALTGDLAPLTNHQLLKLYQAYIRTNTKIYEYGITLPIIDFQSTTFLADETHRILRAKGADQHFEILTMPTRPTYNLRQQMSLLGMAAAIRRNKTLHVKLRRLSPKAFTGQLESAHHQVWRLLKAHTQKYRWVHYVYEGPALSEGDFASLLKELDQRTKNPTVELRRLVNEKDRISKQQQIIQKRLHLNRYESAIIKLARDAVFYKAYRRELQSWSYSHVEYLLREIGRRAGLKLNQVRMLLPKEVARTLTSGKVDRQAIAARLKGVAYGRTNGKPWLLTGQKLKQFLARQVQPEESVKQVSEIKGTVAFSGRATGLVRIVNEPSDMAKMKNRDILVSASTNPNLMPAIGKAAAIVTDEGGLTCHAAIVSRELGLPCVVGTKIATKVFKDGDKVEVDAEHGVVRKIDSACRAESRRTTPNPSSTRRGDFGGTTKGIIKKL